MEKTHIIEKSFKHSNKQCIVRFTNMGHRCGYVAVEKDSPLYGIDYNDVIRKYYSYLNVHGGLTFSDHLDIFPIRTKGSSYYFGFDCAHYNDAKDFESYKKYFKKELKNDGIFSSGTVRTLDFCIHECKSLAEQLTELENLIKEQNNVR